MPFTDTANKQKIREYDKKIIEEFAEDAKLSYFGLPGSQMLDILKWRDCLDSITAFEIDDDDYSDLIRTALVNGLSGKFHAIKADIDTKIIENSDDRIRFPYDLFNLDYSGGALYKDKYGDSTRLDAWKELFNKQSRFKSDFLLFITLNARQRSKGEIDEILDEIEDIVKKNSGEDISLVTDSYKKCAEHQKFKVFIPYLIQNMANHNKYGLKCYPPIFYIGSSGTRMTHFAFKLEYVHGRASVTPPQYTLIEILSMPAKECLNGKMKECDLKPVKVMQEIIKRDEAQT